MARVYNFSAGPSMLPLSVLKLPAQKRVFAPREHLETALSRWDLEAKVLLIRVMLVIAALLGWGLLVLCRSISYEGDEMVELVSSDVP